MENRESACRAAGHFCARLYQVDEEEVEIVASIQAIVRKRDSTRMPVDLSELTETEWDLLKLWDDLTETYERSFKKRLNEVFQALAAMKMDE